MDAKKNHSNLIVCETYDIGFPFVCGYVKSATITPNAFILHRIFNIKDLLLLLALKHPTANQR